MTRPLRSVEGRVPGLRALAGRDPLLARVLLSSRCSVLTAAVATLVLGFGVLSFWFAVVVWRADPAESLAGAARFPTGVVGDSLLLSAAIGASVLAYGGLADVLAGAAADVSDGADVDPRLAASRRRLDRTLASPALAWGPVLVAAIVVVAYHWAWISSSEFWLFESAREAIGSHIPGAYHAIFMTVVIWWDVALAARLVLVGVLLVRPLARSGHVGEATARPIEATWRIVVVLAVLYTSFVTLLWVDRFGLALSRDAIEVDAAAALALALWAAVWAAHARLVVPARDAAART